MPVCRLSDDGEAEAFLRVLQPAEVRNVFIAEVAHGLHGRFGAASGAAVQNDDRCFVRYGGDDLRRDPVVRDVPRALQMPGGVFVRGTYVQQNGGVQIGFDGLFDCFVAGRGYAGYRLCSAGFQLH